MRFLHVNECAEWCREHGASIEEPLDLAPDETLTSTSQIIFAPNGSLGLEPKVARACIAQLGPRDECLLWVTDWNVWPSSENWPAFYALRAAEGELTGIHYKPGHLFAPTEVDLLGRFLLIALQNGWDAHLLPSTGNRISRRMFVSHDGWVALATNEPIHFAITAS